MKHLFAFLLVCSNILFAQYRFQYQVSFKIDSLNRDFVQMENFNLDFYENQSLFYPEVFVKRDSVVANGGSINRSNLPEPKLDYIVSKNHKNNETIFQEMVGMLMFAVQEPREIQWNILNETKLYENYKLQKATTTFAGRNWVAWFSQDIPVIDGPYKFKGLPGLIFNIEDDKKDYVFDLVGIQKNIEKPMQLEFLSKLGIKSVKIDYEKFKKVKKRFLDNPSAFFQQMPGLSELPADELKKISEGFVQREKKQNNKIELNF